MIHRRLCGSLIWIIKPRVSGNRSNLFDGKCISSNVNITISLGLLESEKLFGDTCLMSNKPHGNKEINETHGKLPRKIGVILNSKV